MFTFIRFPIHSFAFIYDCPEENVWREMGTQYSLMLLMGSARLVNE